MAEMTFYVKQLGRSKDDLFFLIFIIIVYVLLRFTKLNMMLQMSRAVKLDPTSKQRQRVALCR